MSVTHVRLKMTCKGSAGFEVLIPDVKDLFFFLDGEESLRTIVAYAQDRNVALKDFMGDRKFSSSSALVRMCIGSTQMNVTTSMDSPGSVRLIQGATGVVTLEFSIQLEPTSVPVVDALSVLMQTANTDSVYKAPYSETIFHRDSKKTLMFNCIVYQLEDSMRGKKKSYIKRVHAFAAELTELIWLAESKTTYNVKKLVGEGTYYHIGTLYAAQAARESKVPTLSGRHKAWNSKKNTSSSSTAMEVVLRVQEEAARLLLDTHSALLSACHHREALELLRENAGTYLKRARQSVADVYAHRDNSTPSVLQLATAEELPVVIPQRTKKLQPSTADRNRRLELELKQAAENGQFYTVLSDSEWFRDLSKHQRLYYLAEGIASGRNIKRVSFPSAAKNVRTTHVVFISTTAENDKSLVDRLRVSRGAPRTPTRGMSRHLSGLYLNKKITPVLLRSIYRHMTGDSNVPTGGIDERLEEALLSGDAAAVVDMRALNANPSQFDTFWSMVDKVVDEFKVAHERRTNLVSYVPFATSVPQMRSDVVQRLQASLGDCFTDSMVPSVSWLEKQVLPRNSYYKSAARYTQRFPVRLVTQTRTLRKLHADAKYAHMFFVYQKEWAVLIQLMGMQDYKLTNFLEFVCMDDKCKIPVGAPGHPVSAGGNGTQRCFAPRAAGDGKDYDSHASDHDLSSVHKLVPSVSLFASPDALTGDSTFYDGDVTVTLKCAITQPSTAVRHRAELLARLRERESNGTLAVLMGYTDGGTDHRCSLRSVQLTWVGLAIVLDLDCMYISRTAPSQSYRNPAERVMATFNLGLQGVTLSRQPLVLPLEEAALDDCNSMASVRKLSFPRAAEKVRATLDAPIAAVTGAFKRLKYTGSAVAVCDNDVDAEIQELETAMQKLDPEVDLKKLTKADLKDKAVLNKYLERHLVHDSHYAMVWKKCADESCCTPRRLPSAMLEAIPAFPYPMEKPRNEEDVKGKTAVGGTGRISYYTAREAMDRGVLGDDSNRPSLHGKQKDGRWKTNGSYKFAAQNVTGFLRCNDCDKARCVYRVVKAAAVKSAWAALLETLSTSFHCGSNPFESEPLLMMNPKEVKAGCNSLIADNYFAHTKTDKFPDTCVHCGTGAYLLERERTLRLAKFATVRPLCRVCHAAGKKWVTKKPKRLSEQDRTAAVDAAAEAKEFSHAAAPGFFLIMRDNRHRASRRGMVAAAADGVDSGVRASTNPEAWSSERLEGVLDSTSDDQLCLYCGEQTDATADNVLFNDDDCKYREHYRCDDGHLYCSTAFHEDCHRKFWAQTQPSQSRKRKTPPEPRSARKSSRKSRSSVSESDSSSSDSENHSSSSESDSSSSSKKKSLATGVANRVTTSSDDFSDENDAAAAPVPQQEYMCPCTFCVHCGTTVFGEKKAISMHGCTAVVHLECARVADFFCGLCKRPHWDAKDYPQDEGERAADVREGLGEGAAEADNEMDVDRSDVINLTNVYH
jgi:hypothetical protein